MLTSFSLCSSSFGFLFSISISFLFGFCLVFTYLYHIYFLSLRVWDSKLTNPKLGDQPQLWPVLPPVTVNYFHKKSPSQMFDWIVSMPLFLL